MKKLTPLVSGMAVLGAAGAAAVIVPAVGSASSPASSTVTASPMSQKMSYGGGVYEMDPPAAAGSASPTTGGSQVTAQQAFDSFSQTGLYSYASNYSKPIVQLGVFTDSGQGSPNADGSMTPSISNRSAWFITYHNVPDSNAGPGTGPPVTVLHDIVAVVDANTGVCLEVLSGLPDPSH